MPQDATLYAGVRRLKKPAEGDKAKQPKVRPLTDITVLLDRSGSMEDVVEQTISGFNKFLNEQQAVPADAVMNLYQFDDQYDVVYEGKDLADAEELTRKTFEPRGMTALRDAIGKTIARTKQRIGPLSEDRKPTQIVFVIITDGDENDSKEYSPEQINRLINACRDKLEWQFVFLGANQDAIATARSYGIRASSAASYAGTKVGTVAAFSLASRSMSRYRGGGESVSKGYFMPEEQKEALDPDWQAKMSKTGDDPAEGLKKAK